MSYIRKTIKSGNTIEVEEYFTNRIGFHDPRAKKEKRTPEQVKAAYMRRREKHLRWLLNTNFSDRRDALITLSYRKDQEKPQTLDDVKADARKYFRRLREDFKRYRMELKYIYCVEIGQRGSRHIHAVVSGAGEVSLMFLARGWDGVIDMKPLFTNGQYEDIAAYFVKQYAAKTQKATGEEFRRCFETSRNLTKPEIQIERIREKDIRKDIEPLAGTALDRSSVQEGIGKITGRPYRFYRLLVTNEIPKKPVEKKENCARATGIQKVKKWIGGILRRWRK